MVIDVILDTLENRKDGCNGALLKDNEGNLYAITSRSTTLFMYV